MSDLQGALIGCGFFARNHMHAWRAVEGATIAAVCDTDRTRAEAFAAEFGAQPFVDPAAMLAAMRPDFVDIVTQPATHRPLVELAAAHTTPVICQKPLAPSLEDARAMVTACRAAAVPFMVHENFRWQRPMRALKEAAAEVGDPFFGRVVFRSGYDATVNQPYLAEDPRFILYDLGVHILDLVRFFLGEAVRLTCHTQRVNPRIKGEDVATVLLKMASGATCVAELSYASKSAFDPFPQTLVALEGPRGRATLEEGYRVTVDTATRAASFRACAPVHAWSAPPFEAIQDSVLAIQQHWAECLRNGREPETSGADNLRTLELVFGAYQSAETGQPYDL